MKNQKNRNSTKSIVPFSGLVQPAHKLSREQASKLFRSFFGQMRVIDPDLRIEEHRVGPTIIEGEQQTWRR